MSNNRTFNIFDDDVPPSKIEATLKEYNFNSPINTYKHLKTIFLLFEDPDEFYPIFTTLLNLIESSADPDRAIVYLLRYLESRENPKEGMIFLKENIYIFSLVMTIFSYSNYFSETIINNPALLKDIIENELEKTYLPEDLINTLENELKQSDEVYLQALKKFQTKHFLRIFVNDILGLFDFEIATREISTLAEVIVESVYLNNLEKIKDRIDKNKFSYSIVALGKLGGFELNYSSDIDVVFIYNLNIESGDDYYKYKELISRLTQRIIKDISASTYGEPLYRIDIRLRPEGSRGEVITNSQFMLDYYYSKGRTWEKQAYIKARVIAGDMSFGESILNNLMPFVYSKYLSYDEIHNIKNLKKKIEKDVDKKGHQSREVKVGYGGIRDVEFILQFYQLLYGGEYPAIRTQNTLIGLNLLRDNEFLDEEDVHTLRYGYIFLREVEHRLQFFEQSQNHLLPENEIDIIKVAIRMRIKRDIGALDFKEKYKEITQSIRSIFNKIFADIFTENSFESYDIFNRFTENKEQIEKALKPYNFEAPFDMYKLLYEIREKVVRRRSFFLKLLAYNIKRNWQSSISR